MLPLPGKESVLRSILATQAMNAALNCCVLVYTDSKLQVLRYMNRVWKGGFLPLNIYKAPLAFDLAAHKQSEGDRKSHD